SATLQVYCPPQVTTVIKAKPIAALIITGDQNLGIVRINIKPRGYGNLLLRVVLGTEWNAGVIIRSVKYKCLTAPPAVDPFGTGYGSGVSMPGCIHGNCPASFIEIEIYPRFQRGIQG